METDGVEEEKANDPAIDDAPTKPAPSTGFELPKFDFSMAKRSQPTSKSVMGEAPVQKSPVGNEDSKARTDGAKVSRGGVPQKSSADSSETGREGDQKDKLDAGQSFQCAKDRSVVLFRIHEGLFTCSLPSTHIPTLQNTRSFSHSFPSRSPVLVLSSPSSIPAQPPPALTHTHTHVLFRSPASLDLIF